MGKMEEMYKFLEMCTLLVLNQGEIEKMNRPIASNDFESVIIVIKLPTKNPGPMASFTGKFPKHLENS